MLEYPTIPVGVISWFFGGAMYLARAVEYSVQIGRTRSSSFEWLFPLTGFRASESVSSLLSPLMRHLFLLRRDLPLRSLISGLPEFLLRLLLWASQLSSPAQKRVMSDVRAAMDFGFSCPRCRASHSSRMLCLKAVRASASGESTICFFLVKNHVQNCLADSSGY